MTVMVKAKMAWSKRQLIEQAFEEIGFASYAFDLQPEMIQSAARRLDALLAQWSGKGIRLGYPMGTNDLDAESNISDMDALAVYSNLAILLAPSRGKTPTNELKKAARSGYRELLNRFVKLYEKQLDHHAAPSGAGNQIVGTYGRRFPTPPTDIDPFTEDDR
jgi:hypothetical protein